MLFWKEPSVVPSENVFEAFMSTSRRIMSFLGCSDMRGSGRHIEAEGAHDVAYIDPPVAIVVPPKYLKFWDFDPI